LRFLVLARISGNQLWTFAQLKSQAQIIGRDEWQGGAQPLPAV
jgi:hypothetical protein